MAQDRPPLPSLSSHESSSEHDHYTVDPFADRHRAINFQETAPSAYDSTISLPQDFGDRGGSDEKLPLTQEFGGGFYPPGSVSHHTLCSSTNGRLNL